MNPAQISMRAHQAEFRTDPAPQTIRPGTIEDGTGALRGLLRVEEEIRACTSIEELGLLLVNELVRMTGARQAYFVRFKGATPRLERASGAHAFERDAPTMQWLAREIGACPPGRGWGAAGEIRLRTGQSAPSEDGRMFPFPDGYWLPVSKVDRDRPFGVLLLAEQPLEEGPVAIASRIAATAAHAATVLAHRSAGRARSPRAKLVAGLLAAGAVVALAWPVSMTALAPLEVQPRDGFLVAAPIDGVIDEIVVAPNASVKAGDLIVRYVDTVPRNQLQLAEREVSVADARLRQLLQTSFVDERAKRELAQARAELALKVADRDFARDTFERSQIRAPRDGIVIFADKKEWAGRPVSTGQRILEVADPRKVQPTAQLPVAEVLDLAPGARIRVYLDGDPLRPLEATLVSMSHQAKVAEPQGLAYRVEGEFAPDIMPPRLGVRGTAQLFGGRAPLAYYLFRRPLIWLRQKVGL